MTKAVFHCDICGEEAATVEVVSRKSQHPDGLKSADSAATIIVSSFTGHNREVVRSQQQRVAIEKALTAGSPGRLYRIHKLWAPFYCPKCNCSYCRNHWTAIPVFDDDSSNWYDSSYGECPKGHKRLIDD